MNARAYVGGGVAGMVGGGALAGLGSYGVYRGGKALVNKIRNRKKDKNK